MTQRPFTEATRLVMEMKANGRPRILHQRLHLLRASKTTKMMPARRLMIEMERMKKMRGLLPLQIDQRMKFGCDW